MIAAARAASTFGQDPAGYLGPTDGMDPMFLLAVRIAAHNIVQRDMADAAKG